MTIVGQEAAAAAQTVVVNDLDQFSLWPAGRLLPAGWRRRSPAMSRRECLAAVEDWWQDLAPASIRPAAGAAAGAAAATAAGVPGAVRAVPLAHEVFSVQAAWQPQAPALLAGGLRVTYQELDESSGRLAHYLRRRGIGPETVVGVHLERGADLIRSLLAVMKAGAAYLPLDPALPDERLTQICAQLSPAAVITAGAGAFPVEWAAELPGPGPRLIRLADAAADLDLGPDPVSGPGPGSGPGPVSAAASGGGPHPDSVGYVIHTSGSTGEPKAVAVSFGSLARVVADLTQRYRIGPGDRVAQFAAMAFDTALEQVFTALTGGAALLLPPPGTMPPAELLRLAERDQVTVLDLTPSYWHQVLALTRPGDERLRSVRLMITGGEPADPADCRAALRAAPRARLLNAYGLTETTITSTLFDTGPWLARGGRAGGGRAGGGPAEAGRDGQSAVPAGTAAGGARIMVLDGSLRPVPAGTPGEVYIGGPGVARGYLGRPGLTADRFLPDPGGDPGGRMYRTGDTGYLLEGGCLVITGRTDRQLKVRGFRVEPAEIERVLARHPAIAEVSVTADARAAGGRDLVARYTLARPAPARAGTAVEASPPPSPASLRQYLADRLPGYMIPAQFISRGTVTGGTVTGGTVTGGTVTGDATPAGAGGVRAAAVAAVEPAPDRRLSPVQAALATLWARLLGRDQIALDDDFFALGGDSLRAAEMLAHARALLAIPAGAVQPLTRSLLRDPSLGGFARAAADAVAGRLTAEPDQAVTDFAAEARLEVSLRPDAALAAPDLAAPDLAAPDLAAPDQAALEPDWRRPREVLLTGATGFLGAHLLRELTATTGAQVHCLVRAPDAAAARSRLREAAARYELPPPPDDRVVPLPGDLAEPGLGLPGPVFRRLAQRLDLIYHAGARVNFIYPYQELRAANVAGTREVIRLAARRGVPVHYVSTTAVLAGLGVAGTRAVTEDTALAHPELLRMGYVETKYVAEELLRAAGRAGLPVTVYRPLDIVGRSGGGPWPTVTEMCALIRYIADTRLAPDVDVPLDFVPVDVCAAAIRHVSVTAAAAGQVYHLASPQRAPLSALAGRLRARGYPVETVPYRDWVQGLAEQAARDPAHPMAAFLPLFVNRGDAGPTVAEMYFGDTFPRYSRDHLDAALRGSGIAFPAVGDALLDQAIGRLIRDGYLPAPHAR